MSGLPFTYQACSPTFFGEGTSPENASSTDSLQRNGNGDTYDGKGTIYVAYDSQSPCAQTDTSGKPLPNAKLAVENTQTLQVRKDCQDQAAAPVDTTRLIFSSFNKSVISFDGLHYQSVPSLPVDQARYVSNVCRGELSSVSNTRLFEFVVRGNENWVNSPTYTAEVLEAVENSDVESISQRQVYPEEGVQRSVNAQGQVVFSRTTGPRPVTVTVGATGQSSADLTVGGENYSGTLSCDFEPVGSNLISGSNDFTASTWLLTSGTAGTVGLEANAIQAPDSSNTGWRLFDQSGTGSSWIRYHFHSVPPGDVGTRTFTVYLKKGTASQTQVKIQHQAGATTIHDGLVRVVWAIDGTASLSEGAATVASSLTDAGNGWYRVSVTVSNNGSGNTRVIPAIYPVDPDSGESDLDVYIWNAELFNEP